ncbi:MAG TPA: ABC transporter permease subunit [Pseudonocardiaceae bacterium]|nr:ABC transporter permease subunit [Pseudonocardiaceae bacterium]
MDSRLIRGVAGLVGLFLIWEIVSQAGLVDSFLLPPPTQVVTRMVSLLGQSDFRALAGAGQPDFVRSLIATLLTWLLSLLITVAIAVPLGILLGSVPGVRTATSAVIEFIRPIPPIALIPVCTVLLGAGVVTTITLAVFAGVWPVLFGVVGAMRETDPMLLDTARVFGLSDLAVSARVRLPAVARAAVIGFRVSVALELIIIVSTGMITGISGGVGAYLWNAGQAVGDTKTVLAGTVIIGIIGYLANMVLVMAQRLPWLHPTASGAPESGQSGSRRWAVRFAQRWGTLVLMLVIWQLVTGGLHNLFAPTPTTIASSAWHNLALLGQSIPISLAKIGIGWGIAAVAGVGLGVFLGLLPRAADVIEPVGAFIRAIPPVLLMPVLVIWVHFGTGLEITTIALGCAWPILVQTIEGVRSIEPVLIDTSHAYRTGRIRHALTVVLPAAAPKIITGLRVSLSLALILMVISELIGGAIDGLGYQLNVAENTSFDYPFLWACFVVLGIIGYLINQLLLFADHRLVSWRHEEAEAQ